ncbi:MAG: M16 family metallopeptidase, partial [Kiloniellaceae bacterium]
MSVRVSTLANGLTVATDSMPTVETVSLGAWVCVGARHEPAAINGIAHLLEHMAFKGTERRSAYDIAQEIEAVGGHLNAYTSRESTAFYAKVLVEDTPLAVDILADILQHPTFDAEELRRERAVVLQEIGQAHDTPDDEIFDRFQETAFPGQSLGRPVLGTAKIVGRIERESLKAYMTGNYGAGTMVLAAAGKIEHQRFVDLAAVA